MRNRNTYKKLCTIMIVLGLVFSVGQLAYAHDPTLKEVEHIAYSNPTINNLKLLYKLYKKDAARHQAKGEFSDKITALVGMRWVQNIMLTNANSAFNKAVQIERCAKTFSSENNWERATMYWKEATKWYTAAGNNTSAAKAKKHVDSARYQATSIRIDKEKIVLHNLKYKMPDYPEIKDYQKLERGWNNIVNLATKIGNTQEAIHAKIKVAKARMKQAFIIAITNKNPEDYENLAKCWDEIAKLYGETGDDLDSFFALSAKEQAAAARVEKADIIVNANYTVDNLENLAKCWDELAKLTEVDPDPIEPPTASKLNAALARASKAEIISNENKTKENYEIWAKCWDELARLYEEAANNSLELDDSLVLYAKLFAANIRVQKQKSLKIGSMFDGK